MAVCGIGLEIQYFAKLIFRVISPIGKTGHCMEGKL